MNTHRHTKPTQIAWLGDVPSHWELKKMKYLFSDISIKNKPNETLLSVTQSQGVVPRDWLETRTVLPNGNLETFKFIEKGDFAISLRSFEGGLEYCYHNGIISPAYTVLRKKSNQLSESYYKHLFKSFSFISEMQTAIVGIREGKNISYQELQYSYLPIPPLPEQLAIAKFLDEKTARIQTAIGIKNEQIAKLKEYRQALINQTVTKGLKANVAMKNSSVAWLGDVPEHWEVLSLKRVARINPSVYVKDKRSDEKVCFLPMEKVLANGQIIDDLFLPIKNVSSGFTIFAKNDVIVAKITPCFENGKSAFLDKLPTEFGYGSTEFHVLRPSKKILGKFLYLIIHSKLFLDNGEAMMIGSAGQKRVPTDFVANFKIALPPLPEQTAIAEFLDEKTAQIDTAISQYQNQIERLKEYRQSLVNDAVTGKIRIKQD